jgi:hypothetical protein
VNEALQAIFDTLKTRDLEEGLLTSQHTNLYDFVDSQSVQKLQRQAVQEIREMEVRCRPVDHSFLHGTQLTLSLCGCGAWRAWCVRLVDNAEIA